MIDGLEAVLEHGGQPGVAELRGLLAELLGAGAGRFLGQELLQPRGARVFRLRFVVDGEPRSVIVKRLDPEIARRTERLARVWLPATGLEYAGTPLLGCAADRDGACVWQVHPDLGDHALDAREPVRERVAAAVRVIARVHTCFSSHALLGEVRLHGGDSGCHFYERNVRDAIYALEAWRPDAGQEGLRDRLLVRLAGLWEALPERTRALTELGGRETLLHGDLWAKNVFVVPTGRGLHARLIDWDHVAVGPVTYDLSTFLLRFQPEERPWVLALYREAVGEVGWHLPCERDLNVLFDIHEYARFANRLVWPAIALVTERAAWGFGALEKIDRWFEQHRPVMVGAG
jgi:hypothetical protein